MTDQRNPVDLAVDLLVYAPIGLALQVKDSWPELVSSGRARFETPLAAAKVIGKLAVDQGRRDFEQRLSKLIDPKPSPDPRSAGTSTGTSASGPTQSAKPSDASATSSPTASSPSASAAAAAASPGVASAPAAAKGRGSSQATADDLAIPGYAHLSASQIIAHLDGLTDADLARIEAHELATRKRKTVLARIEQLRSR